MNTVSKNPEDFEIGDSLSKANNTFQCTEKYSEERLIMKRMQFRSKQDRLDAIRQFTKYQFLDQSRGYLNEDEDDSNNFVSNFLKNRDYVENNYINKYKYYAVDNRLDANDLMLYSEPMQQSLAEKIEKKARFEDYFSTKEIKLLVKSVFAALDYMDNKSLAHFNLKPTNILYTSVFEENYYKVSDYGFESPDLATDKLWESPEILEGNGKNEEDYDYFNYDMYKEQQYKREFNSLNPNHIHFDPIKFDVFRFGLILIQVATFTSIEELQHFKYETNDIEVQKFKDDILETIRNRYDDSFCNLIVSMIHLNHNARPYPSGLKKKLQQFLNSQYDFLGGPTGKGPQDNLKKKFCSEIYQKILERIKSQKKTPEQYFLKYDMNRGLKTITPANFDRALRNLLLTLTPYESDLLISSLETDKQNILSLRALVDTDEATTFKFETEEKSRIKKMSAIDETTYVKGILELNKELHRKSLFLNQILEDPKRISYQFLSPSDFKFQFKLHKVELPEFLLDLIAIRYNINGDGKIACQIFIEDFISLTQVSDDEYIKIVRQIFNIIRQKFLTLDNFFKQYDAKLQKYISENDFKDFLEETCFVVPEKLYSLMIENLVTDSEGKIFLLHLYQFFNQTIVEILKMFFNRLINDLSSQNLILQRILGQSAIKTQPQYIQIEKFSQSLNVLTKTGGPYMKHDEIALVFSLLGIRKDIHGSLDYEATCQIFYEWCDEYEIRSLESICEQRTIKRIKQQKEELITVKGRIGLLSSQIAARLQRFKYEDVLAFFGIEKQKDPLMIFTQFNQKIQVIMKLKDEDVHLIFKHLDKLNSKTISSIIFLQFAQFNIESIGQEIETKFISGIDAKEFNRHQPFIEEILSFLEEKNEQIDSYFASSSGYIHTVNFRYMLMDLDINLTYFKEELNDLISSITIPADPNNVNIELFRELLTHYSQLRTKKNVLQGDGISFENIHFAIQWFIQVYNQLHLMNLTFEKTFERYEERVNEVSYLNVEHVIFNVLKLSRDYAYIFFQKFISKDKEFASLIKIKAGLEKEEQSLKALKEIVDKARQSSMNIDEMFNRFNQNKDTTIDIQEFNDMIKIIHPSLSDELVNHLFLRMDLSGDGYITAREFKVALFGKIADVIQDDEGQLHSLFIEDLQITLLRQNSTLEDFVKEINKKDIITIKDFLDKLQVIGYDVSTNKLKVDSLLSRIKRDDTTIYFQELRQVYIEYKKDDQELRRKGLISEQEEKNLLAYGQLIRREMQRNKHTFETIFKSKRLKNTEYISEQQVRNYFVFDLELNEDHQMKAFFDHLKNICIKNMEGDLNSRAMLLNLDDLERMIYGYTSKDPVEEIEHQVQKNIKETDMAKQYAITINQALLDELIQFISKNNHIKQELEALDSQSRKNFEKKSGFVTAEEFKKVINEAGRYVRIEDIVQLANYFGCNSNGNFLYKRLIEEIEREVKLRNFTANKEIQITNFTIEFKQLCLKLKRELKDRGMNVIELIQKHYRNLQDFWIYESDVWYAFKIEKIYLDYEQTRQLVQALPYRQGKIDYKVLNQLICDHFKDDNRILTQESEGDFTEQMIGGKKVRMIITEDVRDLFREIRKEFQNYLEREGIPLLVLFKRLDLEGDNFISFNEFIKGVKQLFPDINLNNQELAQAVFNRFDKSQDTQIDISEFKAAIFEDVREVQIKPLLKKIRNLMDLKNEDETREEFEKIDIDKSGTLNLIEFSQALTAIDFRFTNEEIQAIFEYFDKEEKNQISYHHFISVLNDDHLNFLKIREKIFDHLKRQDIPMEYFFKRYVMDQAQYLEKCVMNFDQFKRMVRDLGFGFDANQVEELFCYIDENKDFVITIEEFKNKIFECKIDINKTLRNIRRSIIRAELDIEEALKSKDIHKTNTVPYHVWVKLLKQYGVEIKPIEMEAIFKFYSNNAEKELDYIEFINGMISQSFGIQDIQEKILKMCKKYKTEPDKLFELFDEKKDGMLDLHEFAQMLENLQITLSNEELKEAYQVFDLNKDGQINSNEFRAIIEGRTYSNKLSLQQLIGQNYYQKQTMNYSNLHALMQTTGFDPKAAKMMDGEEQLLEQVHIQTKQKEGLPSKVKFDSMEDLQDFQHDTSEGAGSPTRIHSITKLKVQATSHKRRPGLPEFNQEGYIRAIIQAAKEDNIPIFQLFSQYDDNKNFKLYMSGIQKVFKQLRIDAGEKHIGQFFQSSTQGQDGFFYYIPILKKIMQPSSLLSQVLVFSIQANNLKPQQYFKIVRENSSSNQTDMEHWSLGDILFLNKNMGLELDRNYLVEAWNSWLLVAGHQNMIDVKDFIELLGTEAILLGGEDALSEVLSETELKKSSEELFTQLRSIYNKFGINLHDIFASFDLKKDYSLDSPKTLQKVLTTLYIEPHKNHLHHFFGQYKDSGTGKFKYVNLLKYIQQSILLFVIQANQLNYKTFFETLKTPNNRSVYWGVEEFVRISKSFNFQFSFEELEHLVNDWGKKVKGKLSIFDLALALNVRIDASAKDIEAQQKENTRKTLADLKEHQRDIKQSLEQQQQIMTMHFGNFGNFDEADKIKINDYINELSKYINDHNFFDPFESMAKSGQLNYNDIYEALRNGYSIFKIQEDIKLLANWLTADGPILISELSRLLKYDQESKKRQEEREKEKIEKINQGINIAQYERQEVNLHEAELALANLLDTFKKNTATIMSVYFGENEHVISSEEFISITTNACSFINYHEALNLFNYIDINKSGTVTKNEMFLLFGNAANKSSREEQYEKIRASKDINTQIESIFKEVDKDRSSYVDRREFDIMLRAVGIFCSTSELESYFSIFDANKDGKITLDEFKKVIGEKLMNEVMVAEDIVEDLKKQFKLADIHNNRVLNKPQIGQVFLNLGVVLANQELNDLFNVIDLDKSGTIDIDEFIFFMSNNGENMGGVATNVLLNIRSSRSMSLQDMKFLFSYLPGSFQISFTRKKTKKRINLPSSTVKPHLNSFDLYDGIRYEYKQMHKKNRTESLIDRKFVPHKLNVEIKVDVATGVPQPREQVPLEDIISRHVYVSFFDTNKKQIFGNSCRIPAKWDPKYEDRWIFKFDESILDNSLLVRHANYDQLKDMDIQLCFEFCIGIKYSNQKLTSMNNSKKDRYQQYDSFTQTTPDFEVTCCYGLVLLFDLLKSGSKTVTLNGGSPIRDMSLEKDDVRTRRTGWRSLVKAVTSTIKSSLKIEVIRSFPPEELNQISTLPDTVIIPKKSLSLVKSYREYMVAKSIRDDLTLNSKMHNLIEIKTFMRCMDCSDIFFLLSKFWLETVVPYTREYQKELDTFASFMQKLNLIIYHKGFRFNTSDPTATYFSFPILVASRKELLLQAFEELKVKCSLFPPPRVSANPKQQQQQPQLKIEFQPQKQPYGYNAINCYEQFNITDIMSDDDEDSDFDMINSYFNNKNKKHFDED